MVTVRTYWSPAEAALAKSLLDNYEIPCALLDENANLSARGAQFAVPTRLVVDEDEAVRADCILKGDFDQVAEIDATEEKEVSAPAVVPESKDRNPWELLLLAFYLLVPAIFVLRTKYSGVTGTSSWTQYVVARARVTHLLSWLAVILALALIVAYFRIRRSSAKS